MAVRASPPEDPIGAAHGDQTPRPTDFYQGKQAALDFQISLWIRWYMSGVIPMNKIFFASGS
jgi:hypothetical protein